MKATRSLIGLALIIVLMPGLAEARSGRAPEQVPLAQANAIAQPGAGYMAQRLQHTTDNSVVPEEGRMPLPSMADESRMSRPGEHGAMMMRMKAMLQDQMRKMSAEPGPANISARMEERIAFLKAELRISDKQMADWDALADALRSGRLHLLEARKLAVLSDAAPSAERLERYEHHLMERLDAIKSVRVAFMRLYLTLDDAQKHSADAIVVPLIATF